MLIIVNYLHKKGKLEQTQLDVQYDDKSKHVNTEGLCEFYKICAIL